MVDTSFEGLSRRFLDQAMVGIGWADRDGLVKYMNPKLLEMLGITEQDEYINQPVFKFYDPETISKLEDQILSDTMYKGYWSGTLMLMPVKGNPIKTLNYLFSMKDDHGKHFSFGNIVLPIDG